MKIVNRYAFVLNYQKLGEDVYLHRAESGLTQDEYGRLIGVTNTVISRVESMRREDWKPRPVEVDAISINVFLALVNLMDSYPSDYFTLLIE